MAREQTHFTAHGNVSKNNTTSVESENPKRNKAEKFLQLAPKRVNKVLKAIESVGKLSAGNYTYTTDQIEKIVIAIRKAVASMEASFNGQKDKSSDFSL